MNHIIGFWGWFLPDDTHLAEKELGLPHERWDFDFVEKLFRVNTLSYMTLSTSSIPAMIRASKSSGNDSRIVVVSSGAATMGLPKVTKLAFTVLIFLTTLAFTEIIFLTERAFTVLIFLTTLAFTKMIILTPLLLLY